MEKNESEIIIKELKSKITAKEVENNSIETQTESEFQDYYCQHCIYVASCVEELDWHIENAHAEEEPSDIELQRPYGCNICAKRNVNKGQLMIHIRTMHPETVRTCKFFIIGKCDFPDNVCWFMHTKSNTSSSPQMLKQFKCGFCENVFEHKSDFMSHRK